MWTNKEIIIFLAGAEAFHTLSHIFFAVSGTLPVKFWGIKWDQQRNLWAIVINAAITVGLLWWASTKFM